MIRRRRPRHAFAMALMLIVLMVLTVVTVTLVGTGVRDQQSARLSAGRGEARLLATSVLEDFFSRLKEDPTGLYDLLASQPGDSLSGGVFAGYNTAWRRDNTAAKWAVLPSVGRVSQTATTGAVGTTSCAVDDFTQDCFHVEIPEADRLGPVTSPGSFMLRVNLRLRCGGVEARCIYTSFEQRVRRVQFYDFALANEFSTLAPSALFAQGSYVDQNNVNHRNHAAYNEYVTKCVKRAGSRDRSTNFEVFTGVTDASATSTASAFAWDGIDPGLVFTGCVDIAYTGDTTGLKDTFGANSAIYSKDDWIAVCGSPGLSNVFLSGPGLPSTASSSAWSNGMTGFSVPTDCPNSTPSPQVRELNVPAMSLPSGTDVLAATGVSSPTVLTSGTPQVIDLSGKSGLLVYRGDNIASTLDAVIYGNVTGNVSVVVQGSVAIIGDIKYANRNANQVLSLTASERIEIWQSCFGEDDSTQPEPGEFASWWDPQRSCIPAAPTDRTIDGVLTSPEGYIGVPDWLTNTDYPAADCASGAYDCRNQATLNFYGSMTSKFQGVFGAFTASGGTTELVSGYFKNFEHDRRLTELTNGQNMNLTLPPYLVESATPVWVRLDLSEAAYQGS